MVEQRLMTFEEELRVGMEVTRLEEEGKIAESKALLNTLPMQPWAADFIKKYLGLEVLLAMDCNFAEVEQKYGKEWFVQ
jgi:hypothetical protein